MTEECWCCFQFSIGRKKKERWKCAIFGVFTKFWLKQPHWRSRKQNQENVFKQTLKLITIYNVSWTTACNYMIANKSTSNHSVLTVTCILGHFGSGLYEPKKEKNNCIITWMSRGLWTIISHSKSQTSEPDVEMKICWLMSLPWLHLYLNMGQNWLHVMV